MQVPLKQQSTSSPTELRVEIPTSTRFLKLKLQKPFAMASKSHSTDTSATMIRIDSSPSTRVPGWLSLLSIPVIAMSASVVLNTLAAPFFDMKYQAVSSEPNVWLASALFTWRVVELWIGWSLGFDGKTYCDFFLRNLPYYLSFSLLCIAIPLSSSMLIES
jgi:hypothetical protein